MDTVALYLREYSNLSLSVAEISKNDKQYAYELTFSDNLDNRIYNQPLTFEFTVNDSLHCSLARFNPSIYSGSDFTFGDEPLRIHVLPDEKTYRLTLFREPVSDK